MEKEKVEELFQKYQELKSEDDIEAGYCYVYKYDDHETYDEFNKEDPEIIEITLCTITESREKEDENVYAIQDIAHLWNIAGPSNNNDLELWYVDVDELLDLQFIYSIIKIPIKDMPEYFI